MTWPKLRMESAGSFPLSRMACHSVNCRITGNASRGIKLMGNNRTGANQRIKNICISKSINEMDLYARAKLLLEIYRDVCWDASDYAAVMRRGGHL